MAKGKKKWATWQLLLAGCLVSVVMYGGVVFGLSYGIVSGTVPETVAGVALVLGAFFAMLAGGLLFGRQVAFGVMGGCLALLGVFWLVALALAWGCYGGVAWSWTGFALMLASTAGAIVAGVIGRKHKGRRIAKHFG